MPIEHIVLWDYYRDGNLTPQHVDFQKSEQYQPRQIDCLFRSKRGEAPGSVLRAMGIHASSAPVVAFADDDVWWDIGRAEKLLAGILEARKATPENPSVAFTLRKVWDENDALIGVDRFESVGPLEGRKVPYEFIDNNCLAVEREALLGATPLYSSTMRYDDDRLLYQYLTRINAAMVFVTDDMVNQVCPKRLEPFFKQHCSKE